MRNKLGNARVYCILREELKELQAIDESLQSMMRKKWQRNYKQANYAAVESAKDQLAEKSKAQSFDGRLEKEASKTLQRWSLELHTPSRNRNSIWQKLQKQVSDSKHVIAHLEPEEGNGEVNENAANDDNKWAELFDEESGRPYWWSKAQGSTWEKPQGLAPACSNSFNQTNALWIRTNAT